MQPDFAVDERGRLHSAPGLVSCRRVSWSSVHRIYQHGHRASDRSRRDGPRLLYEPPFTDVAATGPEKLFDEEKVTRLFSKIQAINDSAVA